MHGHRCQPVKDTNTVCIYRLCWSMIQHPSLLSFKPQLTTYATAVWSLIYVPIYILGLSDHTNHRELFCCLLWYAT